MYMVFNDEYSHWCLEILTPGMGFFTVNKIEQDVLARHLCGSTVLELCKVYERILENLPLVYNYYISYFCVIDDVCDSLPLGANYCLIGLYGILYLCLDTFYQSREHWSH